MWNFEIAITFDGDVLWRWFFNRWKALNLSFLICYFSMNFDLRKVPKHRFWIETIDFQNSMKISKSWLLDAFLLVKSAFLWFSCNCGNRRSRFENSTKINTFDQIRKLRLSAFHRSTNQRLRTSTSKVMVISKFHKMP